LRQKPPSDLEMAGRRLSLPANGRPSLNIDPVREVNYVRRSSKSSNACSLKPVSSCACAFGTRSAAPSRQKGWRRNKDDEPYAPA